MWHFYVHQPLLCFINFFNFSLPTNFKNYLSNLSLSVKKTQQFIYLLYLFVYLERNTKSLWYKDKIMKQKKR